jgi:hypothetical protein
MSSASCCGVTRLSLTNGLCGIDSTPSELMWVWAGTRGSSLLATPG